jgi:BirA family biotin operon repressor/biotin-[acetyl-CoA-carboxylase] ligase
MEIKKYKIVTSTNASAKKLRNKKVWQVVLAEEQIAGYGRKGSSWYSPKGGLYFSIILPKSKIEDLQTLTILGGFIVAKVIKENFNLEPFIKLPNDVWVNGKKICGILTENVVGKDVKFSVMGIGLNTNIEKFPKDLENIATSLKIELGREVDNKKILEQIVKGIKEQLKTISE